MSLLEKFSNTVGKDTNQGKVENNNLYSSNAILTSDNFIWFDVTDQMKYGSKRREEIWNAFELYVIYDESEALVESHQDIDDAIARGCKIAIEVGFLNS